MNNEVLATVGGFQITNADLDNFLRSVPQEQRMYAQNPQSSYVPDGYGMYGAPQGAYQSQTAPKFEEISDDEELPF